MAQDNVPQIVLSSLNQFPDVFAADGTHPFAASYETNLTALRALLGSANDILRSTNTLATVPLQNSKTASLLREHSRTLQTKHVVRIILASTVECV